MNPLNAKDLKDLLAKRHKDDIFYTEVNTGFTDGIEIRRMDAWALQKSYMAPLTYGYEIKVSRSDFLHDSKMQVYLGFCDEMYLVTIPGVVQNSGELPENFGWLEAQKFGDDYRLRTKRKAPCRNAAIPVSFWRALVINKGLSEPASDPFSQNRFHASSAKEWLAKKSDWLHIGKSIGEEIAHYRRNKETEEKTNAMALRIRRYLDDSFSIDDRRLDEWSFQLLKERVDQRLKIDNIDYLITRIESLVKELKGSEGNKYATEKGEKS